MTYNCDNSTFCVGRINEMMGERAERAEWIENFPALLSRGEAVHQKHTWKGSNSGAKHNVETCLPFLLSVILLRRFSDSFMFSLTRSSSVWLFLQIALEPAEIPWSTLLFGAFSSDGDNPSVKLTSALLSHSFLSPSSSPLSLRFAFGIEIKCLKNISTGSLQ